MRDPIGTPVEVSKSYFLALAFFFLGLSLSLAALEATKRCLDAPLRVSLYPKGPADCALALQEHFWGSQGLDGGVV